jgi:hypothetical protein
LAAPAQSGLTWNDRFPLVETSSSLSFL